ncbi:ABC transporter substrate-binding protein [Wenxinia saemankumensis]|uniref:Peptide/nickel transport system substrate-binding protein n=1 Tax=Wenxinia saemankumensis TaxID=1447782 RepID=A0A1M6FTX9_9RHOB|nr:ABC transporter substrate-binding protein [Wenxinia saemankumensis]SHJ01152.1 peptide/nickel transport system substrate-binding protein [Wenxinia saemankumensis]
MTAISRRLLMRGGAAAGLLAMSGAARAAGGLPAGTLRLALPDLPATPGIGDGRGLAAAVLGPGAVWETLTEIAPSGELTGDLATGWTMEEGGRAWRLTLRPAARFQDGDPVTGEAVAAHLWRVRAPLLSDMVAAEPEAGGLRLVFAAPRPDLPFVLADPALAIAGPGGAGSGAFRVERFDAAGAVLERDPDHPRAGGVARLRLTAVPDPAARLAALRAGEIDAAPVTAAEAGAPGRGLRLIRTPGHQHFVLEAEPALAGALAVGLDRAALAGGQGPVGADSPMPGGVPAPADPFRARALLAQAGLAGRRLDLRAAGDVPPAFLARLESALAELDLASGGAGPALTVSRASGRLTARWAEARLGLPRERVVIPAFADYVLAHSVRLLPPRRIGALWDLDDGRIAQRWQVA